MKIKTPIIQKTTTLKDFVIENIQQSVIIVKNPLSVQSENTLLVVKLVDANKTISVYARTIYFPVKDELSINSLEGLDCILCVNHEYKYVIADDGYMVDVKYELSKLSGYRIITANDLLEEMKDRYKTKFQEILQKELPNIQQTDAYKKEYEKCPDSESSIKSMIRRCYMSGSFSDAYYNILVLMVRESHYHQISNGNGIYGAFDEFNLNTFHKYFSIENFIENMAENNFQYDYDIENIAKQDYFLMIKEEILSNPDDEMLLADKIREAIKSAGKTLTVVLKHNSEDKEFKVENDMRFQGRFRTVSGNSYIKFTDILEMKFSGKTLYKVDKKETMHG